MTGKKLISLSLSLCLILSLLCIVPVAAEDVAPVLGEYNLPYINAGFEDGKTMFMDVSNINQAITSDKAYSGSKSLKLTYGEVAYTSSNVGSSLYGVVDGENTKLSYSVKAGDKLSASLWLNLEQKMASSSRVTLLLWYEDTTLDTSTNLTTYFDETKVGEWQEVKFEHTFAFDNKVKAFEIRMGGYGSTNFIEGESTSSSTVSARTYYIDDFVCMIEKNAGEAEAYSDAVDYMVGDSEDFSGVTYSLSTEASIETYAPTDTKATNDEGNTKFFRITRTNNSKNYLNIELKDKLKTGHTYVVKYQQRVTNIEADSSGYSYINNRLWYTKDDTIQSSSWDPRHTDVIYTDHRNTDLTKNSDGTYQAAEWKTYVTTIGTSVLGDTRTNTTDSRNSYDYAGVAEYFSKTNLILIHPSIDDRNGPDAIYDFDNIEVIDLGILSNGGVDTKYYGTDTSTEYNYVLVNGNRTPKSAGVTEYQADFAGWYTSGTSGTDYKILRQAASTHTNASEAQLTWWQYTENGKLWQPLPMKANQQYKLTFWIRNASGDLQNDYTYSVRVKLDRSGGETLNSYAAYNTAGDDGDYIEYGDWMDIPKDGVYTKYEMIIDNTFPLLSGKKLTDTSNVLPEIAIMSLEFASTDNTVFTSEKAGGDLVVYIDDFALAAVEHTDVPMITEAKATAVEGVVMPSYTYTTAGGVAADKSVYNVVKDGVIYASSYAGGGNLALPDGLEDASLQIIPISSTGYIGTPVVVDIETAPSITGITLTQDSGSVTVATDTALTNAKLIFVTYDANNKMVDWEAVDVTLDALASKAYAPVDLTAGSYTKAMLWQDMTQCIPLADMIQYY